MGVEKKKQEKSYKSYIYLSNLTRIGSDNHVSPDRPQDII